MIQYVHMFSEGDRDQKDLLGGKGANLAEMVKLGLPVPPGFTITTEACRAYLSEGRVPPEVRVEVTQRLRDVEDLIGRPLGDSEEPLLLSVRSGAKFSMPGMMETVLNVGLNDESVNGLAAQPDSAVTAMTLGFTLLPAALALLALIPLRSYRIDAVAVALAVCALLVLAPRPRLAGALLAAWPERPAETLRRDVTSPAARPKRR